MKKFIILALGVLIASSLSGCMENENNHIAVIKTSMGTMKVELYEDKMPATTKNFIKLANNGFYNGLVFHRVIDNFMIQGGGFYPNGTNKESPYGPIDFETNPDLQHVDGAISMARTTDPNSATSQFFICDGAQHFLDGQYAAFGRVIEGMDVLEAIASVDTTTKNTPYGPMQDWPVDEVIINSITIEEQ
ncbi:MAG: peptidylprolyl isomerase [Candidatus Thermoplasmatota archaeon]|nr:peptidylprolyl isomerase [Candidatus Thermoplasmatota archaeon]